MFSREHTFPFGEGGSKMRRISVLVIAVLTAITLTGCGGVPVRYVDHPPSGDVNVSQQQQVVVQVEAPEAPTKPEPTEEPAKPEPTGEPETSTQPEACQEMAKGEVRMVEPGHSIAGDIIVNDTIEYNTDDRIEGTVFINKSSSAVKVEAPFGAGCVVTEDVTYMVNREFRSGCGNGCDYVHCVVVTDEKTEVTDHTEPID